MIKLSFGIEWGWSNDRFTRQETFMLYLGEPERNLKPKLYTSPYSFTLLFFHTVFAISGYRVTKALHRFVQFFRRSE